MKKQEKKRLKVLLGILVAFILIYLLLFFWVRNSNNQTLVTSVNQIPTVSSRTKFYRSLTLKFSINVPSDYQIEERFTTVNLKNSEGEITIGRVGTNFTNIEDYLIDISKKNKTQITNQNKLVINKLNAMKSKINYPGGPNQGEIVYYLYKDYTIYSLSTSSPSLFNDLDQIAQSFQYLP